MTPNQDNDTKPNWRGITCVVTMIGLFAIIAGINPVLFAIILKSRSVSPVTIGLNSAMTPVGLLLSAFFAPRLAHLLGAKRLALISVISILALFVMMRMAESLVIWFPLRFLMGCCIGAFYVVNKAWLNEFATPRYRGRIIGLYATVLGGGFASGPFLLALTGSAGWPPFSIGIAAAGLVASCVLVFGSMLPSDAVTSKRRASVVSFVSAAPMLVLPVAMFAFFDQSTLALLPTFAASFDISNRQVAVDLGFLHIGDVVLQFAIGWGCDRFGSRRVSVGCAALTGVCAALLPFLVHTALPLWVLLFLWGALAYGLTTAALAELGTRFAGEQLLAGSAAFTMAGGFGGLLGPPIVGAVMSVAGPLGLPIFLGIAFAILTVGIAVSPLVRTATSNLQNLPSKG